MKVIYDDIEKGSELLFVNASTATIVNYWDSITTGLQILLVVTAVIYNITRIHSWYVDKIKKPKGQKIKQEDEKSSE